MKFNLTRRFALLALVSIMAVSIASSALLSRALAERIIHHDAEVFQSFVNAAMPSAVAARYFDNPADPTVSQEMLVHFREVVSLQDVVHANVYDARRKVIWSTKSNMIGQVLPINPELDEALEGELEVESNILEERHYLKPEHIYLVDITKDFVETYVPIWDVSKQHVLGVLEVYRTPRALFGMTWSLIRGVWTSALLGGLFLFAVLFWVVRRADRLIQAQQRQIVETETLAAVGEMSSAVAHSIRNPLASIRTSAELTQELHTGTKSVMGDIIAEVDRIATWIKELLMYGQPAVAHQRSEVDLYDAVDASLKAYTREFEKHQIRVNNTISAGVRVMGDANLYSQAFNSILSNAIEAMPSGGEIYLDCKPLRDGRVEVQIRDTGSGMSPEEVKKAFLPFQTSKRTGLGIGLALVHRVVERFGGRVSIDSQLGTGTSLRLLLPTK